MKNKSELLISKVTISPCTLEGNPVFGEGVTYAQLQDEGGGLFIEIIQEASDFNNGNTNVIRLDTDDALKLIQGIKLLVKSIERWEKVEESIKVHKNS